MGNHDEWMLKPDYHSRQDTIDEVVEITIGQQNSGLTAEDLAYLHTFKATAFLNFGPQDKILFFMVHPDPTKI